MDLIQETINPVKKSSGRKILYYRESKILSCLYDFEHNRFARYNELADEFQVSSERIRQLHKRALKRIGQKGRKLQDDHPSCQVIRIIKERMKFDKASPQAAITNIWRVDLYEFPHDIIVSLLAHLFFEEAEERKATLGFLRQIEIEERRQQWYLQRDQRYAELRRKQFDVLIASVVWFDHVKTYRKESFFGKVPKRIVNVDDRYRSGTFLSTKCDRHVQFESGQELALIKKLEVAPQVIYYWEQPVTIHYCKFGIERNYTPDFAVLLEDGRCFIVERKDLDEMLDARVQRRMEALMDFCEKHGMGLLLTDGEGSLEKLKNRVINLELEKELRERLSERNGRTMFFLEYKELMSRYNATKLDFLAIVLKNNWTYYPFKFKLSPKPTYQKFRLKVIDRF